MMTSNENNILEITQGIRNFINSSTVKKSEVFKNKETNNDWSSLCIALDTLGDTYFAIENFKENAKYLIDKNSYITVYGILQSLFIQQDSVNHLKISLFGNESKIVWYKEYPELDKVRQLRNETIGHPVETKKKGRGSIYTNDEITSCLIYRDSITESGFEYFIYKRSGVDKKSINFFDIIKLQEENLYYELNVIMKNLKKEECGHKKRFKGKKLLDYFNSDSLYEVTLIHGVIWDDSLGWSSFDHYYKIYKKIRKGLEERYGEFEDTLRIAGTKELVYKLDFIFSKLEDFKSDSDFEKYEFEIYVDALDRELSELKEHLKNVDEEFNVE